ncbi:MAG: helix-turn-helix transcriptional regulator, partial [Gammaproteobacteria bacterium]|nr:helix-turn-helix transcriptional regulator [Gammaproteobacteria bacterium]
MRLLPRRGRGRPPHPDVLTPAEWRVLEHVRDGRSNAEIAERLGLSLHT